jgi:hypothetical protein
VKAVLCIDDAVGEYRRALLDPSGRPFRLEIERWSERGRRAKLDEIWWGRLRTRTVRGDGWYVDLGLKRDGVIESTRAKGLTEGLLVAVRVKAEAWADKGALLSLADMSPAIPRPDEPQRHAEAPDTFLAGVTVAETLTEADARREIEWVVDEVEHELCRIPDGGDIAVEGTRALTAIDVDSAGRLGAAGEAFSLGLNLEAAGVAARQVALRSLGGLVVTDFVSMKQPANRKAVTDAFREHLEAFLGRASDVRAMSPLGLCEAAIARRRRPVIDALDAPEDEREALDALRMIETAGRRAPGSRVHARISEEAAAWLAADTIGWETALADRIGRRWALQTVAGPVDQPEVWSV